MHGCVGAFFIREIYTKPTRKTRKIEKHENPAKITKRVHAFKSFGYTSSKYLQGFECEYPFATFAFFAIFIFSRFSRWFRVNFA